MPVRKLFFSLPQPLPGGEEFSDRHYLKKLTIIFISARVQKK